MLIIGILCLFVAAISYFRYLSEKQNNAKKNNKTVQTKPNGNALLQLFS